jgi:ABC-type multidrug transport system fused ATPase/permease subunit
MDENPRILENLKKTIEFRNVSFRYTGSDEKVIDQLSLEIPPGKTIALVGSSGSGKTTIAMLLLRFYDPERGLILVDGCDLRNLDLKWFRDRIGIVFQDPFLFNMSIRDNISFGKPDADEEGVIRAAKAAYASDFIAKLSQGFDTIIGERGVFLSGGQQQRLAIARAMVKEPDLVILDEATSALDTESEKLVQKAMDHLLQGRTSIVIAHRLSTVRSADTIVVIEGGSLVEKGSYKELIDKKGRFWQLKNTLYE